MKTMILAAKEINTISMSLETFNIAVLCSPSKASGYAELFETHLQSSEELIQFSTNLLGKIRSCFSTDLVATSSHEQAALRIFHQLRISKLPVIWNQLYVQLKLEKLFDGDALTRSWMEEFKMQSRQGTRKAHSLG